MHIMRQMPHKGRAAYPKLQYGERQILAIMTPRRIERFRAKIDARAGPRACHPWRGSRNTTGYGLLQGSDEYRGFSLLAHRIAWTLDHGREPAGMVLHTCDNPLCCNPRHLYDGSAADNAQDMTDRDRRVIIAHTGADANAARFAQADRELAWRYRFEMRLSLAEIAERLGCHRATVSRWLAADDPR